ncbi:alpha/beta fold hydrolase [Enemella evansiae]|uniref:alpha/beta fold hydrolase n=1 Tax=Enemella evansiae TaxID=2016499 RepID=UPI00113FC6CE|nr:alpha/beta hydrolase [Enemella evansiae]
MSPASGTSRTPTRGTGARPATRSTGSTTRKPAPRKATPRRPPPRKSSPGRQPTRRPAARARSTAAPRRRRWLPVLLLVLGLLAGWLLQPAVRVGQFTSAAGHDRYAAAYTDALRDLPPPAASLDLRTDFGVVRVHRFAGANPQQPALVLLADRARATPDWAPLVGPLVRQRTVYAVDTLGDAGMSLQSRPLESDSDAANWLYQVLGQLPGREYVLVGAGTGGWAAMNLAVRRPGPVAGLILIDPERVFAEPPLSEGLRRWASAEPDRPEGWQRAWLEQHAGAPVRGATGRLAVAGLAEHRDRPRVGDTIPERQLRELQLPTLALLAGGSGVQDVGTAETRARLLPRATVRTLPGAPHDLLHTRTPEVLSEVTAFLR